MNAGGREDPGRVQRGQDKPPQKDGNQRDLEGRHPTGHLPGHECPDRKKKKREQRHEQPLPMALRAGSGHRLWKGPPHNKKNPDTDEGHRPPLQRREGVVTFEMTIEGHQNGAKRENEHEADRVEEGGRLEKDPLIGNDPLKRKEKEPLPVL